VNPIKYSKYVNFGEFLGLQRPPYVLEELRMIDQSLPKAGKLDGINY
jgi:hypothetical protein